MVESIGSIVQNWTQWKPVLVLRNPNGIDGLSQEGQFEIFADCQNALWLTPEMSNEKSENWCFFSCLNVAFGMMKCFFVLLCSWGKFVKFFRLFWAKGFVLLSLDRLRETKFSYQSVSEEVVVILTQKAKISNQIKFWSKFLVFRHFFAHFSVANLLKWQSPTQLQFKNQLSKPSKMCCFHKYFWKIFVKKVAISKTFQGLLNYRFQIYSLNFWVIFKNSEEAKFPKSIIWKHNL